MSRTRHTIRAEKTVLLVVPQGEPGFYTSLAEFCRDNAGTAACEAAKRLRKGQTLSIGGGASDHFSVKCLGPKTRADRLKLGIDYDRRAPRTRRGQEVEDYGERMPSDTFASHFPERGPRYGARKPSDPYLARISASRFKHNGKGFYEALKGSSAVPYHAEKIRAAHAARKALPLP